ncbi:response regulator [Bdellovibrio svalbardensis]|uniref:Response regulator n=1 Tax=Bdellovibrio svalbardensis TaxID=2972972 RepID=A0ABT6DMI7_9BACT|nr:response regulator [Bdellovibrio svalbardensis]MDG0817866.1 response regulator [Bdellovibrio svalbardensis]
MEEGTIVLLEDDKSAREIISDMLERGFPKLKVVAFQRGDDALDFLFESNAPVIGIVSDLMMKDFDGIDFLAAIKKHPRWAYLPFIFLSGADYSVFQNLINQYKIASFLAKPVKEEVLIQSVQEHFLHRRRRVS